MSVSPAARPAHPISTDPPAPLQDHPAAAARLASLRAQIRAEMDMMSFATQPWVIGQQYAGQDIPDVVIIGAGQSGLGLGHMLKRRGITNVLLLDRNPAGYEGVWDTYARNHEIRSPKGITGLEMGLPSLTVHSWFVARYGQPAWDAITRVPRVQWMEYLRWYRAIADLQIRNDVTVTDIAFDADGVSLTTADGGAIRSRYVVLATGMEGGGDWAVPDFIRDALPPTAYSHVCHGFDAAALRGKDVGVLGAGASAFDASVAALDAGARSVQTFMRRPDASLRDLVRAFEYSGFLGHAAQLSHQTKWDLGVFLSGVSQAPAEHHFNRALAFDNFRFWRGAPWTALRYEAGQVVVDTPKGTFRFDHIIAATGLTSDMTLRPELQHIAAAALRWGDVFQPSAGRDSTRLRQPLIDADYRFQPRAPGSAPGLTRVYTFNSLAMASMGGLSAVSISSHRYGLPRLADAMTKALFLDQEHLLIPMLEQIDTPCMTLSPYAREVLGLNDAPDV
ncbi:oxidoreductase [Ketogulonicigenium robustum]|uniref:Oxidoreductase n=1 Tax=Ketogulonicigenium robustum TaxID=92947 RepID=A0A1W6NW23_9RHOB|nr:NAD(P)/FAD-dependent oxidoreductase [Ketogulonicigenium robustum]ARO13436.1 oxidoreductase [Ketogulonicigenium robustum]